MDYNGFKVSNNGIQNAGQISDDWCAPMPENTGKCTATLTGGGAGKKNELPPAHCHECDYEACTQRLRCTLYSSTTPVSVVQQQHPF